MKARALASARGERKPAAKEPKVWFTSAESFARVLLDKNRALLDVIAATEPQSLAKFADRANRRTSNLSRPLKTMERYGLVALKHTLGRTLAPVYRTIPLP